MAANNAKPSRLLLLFVSNTLFHSSHQLRLGSAAPATLHRRAGPSGTATSSSSDAPTPSSSPSSFSPSISAADLLLPNDFRHGSIEGPGSAAGMLQHGMRLDREAHSSSSPSFAGSCETAHTFATATASAASTNATGARSLLSVFAEIDSKAQFEARRAKERVLLQLGTEPHVIDEARRITAAREAESAAQSKRRGMLLRFCPVSAATGVLGGGGGGKPGSGSGGAGGAGGAGGGAAGSAKKPPRTSFEEIAAFGAP